VEDLRGVVERRDFFFALIDFICIWSRALVICRGRWIMAHGRLDSAMQQWTKTRGKKTLGIISLNDNAANINYNHKSQIFLTVG
jgi:hypothetical protein